MRTVEGIKKAHELRYMSGHKKGTTYETSKSKRCKEIIKKHSLTFGGTLYDIDVMKLCGCSRNSYYKYKSELIS